MYKGKNPGEYLFSVCQSHHQKSSTSLSPTATSLTEEATTFSQKCQCNKQAQLSSKRAFLQQTKKTTIAVNKVTKKNSTSCNHKTVLRTAILQLPSQPSEAGDAARLSLYSCLNDKGFIKSTNAFLFTSFYFTRRHRKDSKRRLYHYCIKLPVLPKTLEIRRN